MLAATRGIIIHHIDYSETSIIAKVFTEQFGLQSYIVKGVRKFRSKIKSSLFAPLTLVNLEVYHKEQASLQFIKEITVDYHSIGISSDFKKSAILLFMDELLFRSLHTDMPDPGLFNFIYDSVIGLDKAEGDFADYHLVFAIRLTRFLGFFPHSGNYNSKTYFDMQEAVFVKNVPDHPLYIDPGLSVYFMELMNTGFPQLTIALSYQVRLELLGKIIEFYRIHLPGFGEMHSHKVLAEVLKD